MRSRCNRTPALAQSREEEGAPRLPLVEKLVSLHVERKRAQRRRRVAVDADDDAAVGHRGPGEALLVDAGAGEAGAAAGVEQVDHGGVLAGDGDIERISGGGVEGVEPVGSLRWPASARVLPVEVQGVGSASGGRLDRSQTGREIEELRGGTAVVRRRRQDLDGGVERAGGAAVGVTNDDQVLDSERDVLDDDGARVRDRSSDPTEAELAVVGQPIALRVE